uniref:SJCHGC03670 protein n=1 Tax=Schistosoma japonicum TaxID=6182 RepID=Q5BSP0_SCHJA|nr:SJCHGC03670 protein [Schistosoma japonicum]
MSIRSSILSYLVDSGHAVKKMKSFKVIYRVLSKFPNRVHIRLQHITKTIGIRTNNSSQYVFRRIL